jgi:hypothetical protein
MGIGALEIAGVQGAGSSPQTGGAGRSSQGV